MVMKLKTVTVEGKTYAEVEDGKPVYIHDDGKEVPFDAVTTVSRISTLNREAQSHREAKEAAEASLKTFEGLDPEKARKAVETVANLDAKKLVDAGQVEEVKQAAIKAVEEKYQPVVSERDNLKREIYGERTANLFNGSKFITEKLAVPADVVRAVFAPYFKEEGGKPVAYFSEGHKVFSRQNPGSDPSFDEALEQLIDIYPYKESLLKGTGGGSGAKPNGAGGTGGSKEMKRSDWDALAQHDKDKTIKDGVKIVD